MRSSALAVVTRYAIAVLPVLPLSLLLCGCSLYNGKIELSGSLTFSSLTGTYSAGQTATVTNPGTIPVNISSVTLTGSGAGAFIKQDGCKGILASGQSCPVSLMFFSPTAGTYSANLTLAFTSKVDGAQTQAVALTGTAIAPTPTATLSTTSANFPTLVAGTVSGPVGATLSNTGTAPLALSGVTLGGSQAALFSQTNNCPVSLPVGATCAFNFMFAPKIAGSYAATVTLADNAGPSTQTIALSGTAMPAAITIDTTTATDWKIANGALNIDWNSTTGLLSGIHLAGYADNLVDTTNSSGGIYMDNAGLGTGTSTATYTNAGTYLDLSITIASNSANAYTFTRHFIVLPNDPGVHLYLVVNHAATDIVGSLSQIQWVYRTNLTDFTTTYAVNSDLSNPTPVSVPQPPPAQTSTTDPGRAVSNAVVDLHGFPATPGFTRPFYTKYDYSSYNYLHQAHGVYGSTFGTWAYFPSNESTVGGPTKQNLIFTDNILIIEPLSTHFDSPLLLSTTPNTASSRLFGPFYVRFNALGQAYNSTGSTIRTPDDMYADAVASGASFKPFYDTDAQLVAAGYVPSNQRGTVAVQVNGVTGAPHTAWAVLSDPAKNQQLSVQGGQYWADISANGAANFTGVLPGTYRLSVYSLGQWGEYRQDNVVVKANQTTTLPAATFVPENFGTTVFTIGTPDRSSHEFLHGHDAAGHDDREYWGTWNYWADFANNKGSVIYNATSGPAGPATNDLTQWNYDHWSTFDPGLFGGVYSATDDTIDGYKYVVPAYVAGLPGASGTNGVATKTPAWQVHFATPQNASSYQYVVLSAAIACDYGSYIATINGTARTWGYRTAVMSDCSVRSGLSGYTLWLAFQFPVSALNPAGADNVLSLSVSQADGVMDDALRLELTNTSAAPSVRGWNDYEFIGTSSTSANIPASDTVPNPQNCFHSTQRGANATRALGPSSLARRRGADLHQNASSMRR